MVQGCSSSIYILYLLLAVAAAVKGVSVGAGDPSGPVIATKFGKVQGINVDEARIFRSIPYAAPVDGFKRWTDPEFPEPWEGVFNATREGLGCPQVCDLPPVACPQIQVENCLLLNIYTPLNATPNSNLPVLVFIHGGEFKQEYGGSLLYDGRFLVKTGIIVVTINYRLGAMANLLYGSGDRKIKGNYGIKDQRLALEWIRMNIDAFGGNPNDVTISGQSAGGVSVAIHMVSTKSAGLFKKAIIQSYPFSVPLKSVSEAKKLGEDFATAIGCGKNNDYDCLYSKTMEEVANATSKVNSKIIDYAHILEIFLQWTPIVDGEELVDQPLTLFEEGLTADVPLIVGTTSQEGVSFVYNAFITSLNESKYDEWLLLLFPFHYETIRKLYPPVKAADERPIASVMGTDEPFTCPSSYASRAFSRAKSIAAAPVYRYVFDHAWSFKEAWGKDAAFCGNASCHGSDLPFMFDTASLGGYTFTSAEMVLSDAVLAYITNFVKYGNPNDDGKLKVWPPYFEESDWLTMLFKIPNNEVVSQYRKDYCNVLDEIGYKV